jgi:hypothetical protein
MSSPASSPAFPVGLGCAILNRSQTHFGRVFSDDNHPRTDFPKGAPP